MDWDDDADNNRKKRKEWRKQKGYDGYLPFTPSSPWNKDGTKKPDDLPPIQKVKKPSTKPTRDPAVEAAKAIKAEVDDFQKMAAKNEEAREKKLDHLRNQLKQTDRKLKDITAKIRNSLNKNDRPLFDAIESVRKDVKQSQAFGNKVSPVGNTIIRKMNAILDSSRTANIDQLKNNRDTVKNLISTVDQKLEPGNEKSLISNQLNTTLDALDKSIKTQTKTFEKFSSMFGRGLKGFILGSIATESPMLAIGLNRLFSGSGAKNAKKIKADALRRQQMDMDKLIQQQIEDQKDSLKSNIKKVSTEASVKDIATKADSKYGIPAETFARVAKNEEEFNHLMKGVKEKMEIDLELQKVEAKERKKLVSAALIELREMRESLVTMVENDKVVIKKMNSQEKNLEQIKENSKKNPIAEEEMESEASRSRSGYTHDSSGDKKVKDGKGGGFFSSLMGAVFGGNILSGFVSKFMGFITTGILSLMTPATLIPLLARLALPALIITAIGSGLIDGVKEYQKSGDLKKSIEKGIYGFVETLTFGLLKEEDVKAIDKWADETVEKYIKRPLKELWKSIEETFIKFKTKVMDWIDGLYNIGSKIMNLFNMDAQAAEFDARKTHTEQHNDAVERMKAKLNPTGNENNNANRRLKDDIVVPTPKRSSTELPEKGKPIGQIETKYGKEGREQREQNIGTPPSPPPVAVPERRSDSGASSPGAYDFIKKEEDRSLFTGKNPLSKAYQDGKKGKSIGYGHFLSADEMKNGIKIGDELVPVDKGLTKEQADRLFDQDVKKYEKIVQNGIGEDNWKKLNESQRTALVSYAYNTGKNPQGIKAALDKDDMKAAGKAIANGIKTSNGGIFDIGLAGRRDRESKLFPSAVPVKSEGSPPVKLDTGTSAVPVKSEGSPPVKLDTVPVPRADGHALKLATTEYEDNMTAAGRKPSIVMAPTNIGGSSTNVSNNVQNHYSGPITTRHEERTIRNIRGGAAMARLP